MIFLNRPKDSLAPDDGKQRPLRILGQITGPNGEIIEAKTGKVVAPACGQTFPVDDGLGEGEDRLEVVADLPPPCMVICSPIELDTDGAILLRQDGRASWASFHGSRTADASSRWSSSAVSSSSC